MTSTTSTSGYLSRPVAWTVFTMLVTASLLGALLCASSAKADLQFKKVGVSIDRSPAINDMGNGDPSDDFPFVNRDGTFVDPLFERQAGSHPDLSVFVSVPTTADGPVEALRDVELDLPKGMVGNPTAIPECKPEGLVNAGGSGSKCPVEAQVGLAEVTSWAPGGPQQFRVGIYNIAHGPDIPARFGFNFTSVVGLITARVRPGDYGISSGSFSISQAEAVESVRVTLWGVPADPSHDWLRQGANDVVLNNNSFNQPSFPRLPSASPRLPFLSLPPACTGKPLEFSFHGDSWEHPGKFDNETVTSDEDGTPFVMEGCDRVPFRTAVNAQNLAHSVDTPTGLDVKIAVNQPEDPDGIATAHVRQVKMKFPVGVSVSPSSAAGLAACSQAQIGLGTNDPPACPASSKVGTITIDTPLLDDPIVGDVLLAKQKDNPFGSLIALYIAAKGPGFYLKLPGRIDLDPTTGQVTAIFDNTPQLPFSSMQVHFNGGSQAALATPTQCGTYYTHVDLYSWASDDPNSSDVPMDINENCTPKSFSPSFSAGTTNPLAGQFSAFSFSLTRSDGMPFLSQISTALPPGLLADISSVPQCDPVPAANGFCPEASRIGTTSVLSGPGAQPLPLSGGVYLTGPYKNPATGQDAPFGLSIAVPTAGQAGPFDLGVVTVRAGIYVDRTDAHVTVKSDPLPTIIQGIPLRMRQVNLSIDRPKFIFNPTSCAKKSIFGSFAALGGGSSDQAVAFRAGGCGDLDLKQKLTFRLTGKNSTKDGTSPGVDATLTDIGGGSNLDKAEVKLPLALALEPENAQALCKPAEALARNCPKTSIVGTATAKSVLPHDLTGPVYFVEGTRISKTGRVIKTLPKLWIPLSGDGVTIDVNASSDVDSIDRLVTTFYGIPDAPIKSFRLKITGGKHGILVVSGKSTCDRDMSLDTRYTGQNGQTKVGTLKASVEGCKPKVKSTKSSSKSVTVKVGNLSAGKLTVSGAGLLARASKTLKAGPEATVTAKLTSKARATLRRLGKVTVAVRIAYRPKAGKAVTLTQRVTVSR